MKLLLLRCMSLLLGTFQTYAVGLTMSVHRRKAGLAKLRDHVCI